MSFRDSMFTVYLSNNERERFKYIIQGRTPKDVYKKTDELMKKHNASKCEVYKGEMKLFELGNLVNV